MPCKSPVSELLLNQDYYILLKIPIKFVIRNETGKVSFVNVATVKKNVFEKFHFRLTIGYECQLKHLHRTGGTLSTNSEIAENS